MHPSLLQRKIIHFDMDAFYASVEIRDNPALQGKPVVVGGSPQSRGVVCTASYEARKFGIRSAMSSAMASRLCPHAIFLPVNFDKYRAASEQIHAIFRQHTDLVEPLSLDEAFLDVTTNHQGQFAVKIAHSIQQEIWHKLKLTGSAGIAPNKLVAKIASDFKKPFGLTVVLPNQVEEFMRMLPLRKIHGVGPVTERRLKTLGYEVCSDVWPKTEQQLCQELGDNAGHWLFEMSRGIDQREVCTSYERKSMGREETFAQDLQRIPDILPELRRISNDVAECLADDGLSGRTITLKLKYSDFETITRRLSLAQATADAAIIFDQAVQLLERTEVGERKIRLIGVSVSNFA
jgi:DNA polymerase-4